MNDDRPANDPVVGGLKQEVGGRVENLGGRVEQAAGSVTGDRRHEAKGALARVRGTVRAWLGEVRRRAARNRPVDQGA